MSLTQTGYGCWDLNAAEMMIFFDLLLSAYIVCDGYLCVYVSET